MESVKKRNYSYDLIRILACFLVIVNHTNSSIFLSRFPSTTGTISLVYFFISKIAVGLFIMISGALLLGKQESYKHWFTHRFLRMAVALILISYLYFVLTPDVSAWDIRLFVKLLIQGGVEYPLWYLYMQLGLLLCLPLLRKMIAGFEKKDYCYLLAGWILLSGCYPLIRTYWNVPKINSYFNVPFFTNFIGYFVIGYVIAVHLEIKKPLIRISWFIGIASLSAEVLLTISEYYQNGKFLLNLDSYDMFFTMILGVCVYLNAIYFGKKLKISEKAGKVIRFVSSSTFGIYMFHMMIIEYTPEVRTFLDSHMHPLLAIVIYEGFVFTVGMALTKILQLIPGIRKLL